MARQPSVERRRALEILRDVGAGQRADESLARHGEGLDARRRAFLMELAYGAVRWRGRLDWHLDALLEEPLERLSDDVRSILELGAYQILFMNRVPQWAAVDESVRLARVALPGRVARWAAGLVNGVLRNLARRRDALALPDAADLSRHLSVKHSHPRWLVARWLDRYGREATEELLARNNDPPRLHLAVNSRTTSAEAVLAAIATAGHEAGLHPHKSDAVVVGHGARPDELPGWQEGHFWVQDAAAQWVVEVADPPRGLFFDACAAPGGKLFGLLVRSEGGRALAADLDPARLVRIRQSCDRLGLVERWIVAADARRLPTEERFAFALADVPCSGTGVLRRRVDARWRRAPGDLASFAALQREILDSVADRLLPGGTLVYATCSLEPEENEEIVAAFLVARPAFRLEPVSERVPGLLRDGPFLASRPWTGDLDGMFAARLVREAA